MCILSCMFVEIKNCCVATTLPNISSCGYYGVKTNFGDAAICCQNAVTTQKVACAGAAALVLKLFQKKKKTFLHHHSFHRHVLFRPFLLRQRHITVRPKHRRGRIQVRPSPPPSAFSPIKGSVVSPSIEALTKNSRGGNFFCCFWGCRRF